MSWLSRITGGLGKTAASVTQGLKAAVGLSAKLDAPTRDALEEVLIAADTGLPAAQSLLDDLRKSKLAEPFTLEDLKAKLAELIAARLQPLVGPLELNTSGPTVIVVAGVNGAGKTTTIGKLAAQWAGQGKQVTVAAADTFRAAAVEQLEVWTHRAHAERHKKGGVTIIAPAKTGEDSAAVAYRALEEAQKSGADVVIIDTAGRLPNRTDLLAELPKITRTLQKLLPAAPHHTLLVLDGTLGQSTIPQVRQFVAQTGITGLVVTKLDGTAKAGFLLALAAQQPLPVVAIGVGEKLEDLGPFNPQAFARALVGLAT
jgi:fused signal recognition particle receptor